VHCRSIYVNMCIRRETREKARRSLAFSPVCKPRTHITYMLRQCKYQKNIRQAILVGKCCHGRIKHRTYWSIKQSDYIYNTCALSKHIGNMCTRLRNRGKGEASPSLFPCFAPNTHIYLYVSTVPETPIPQCITIT
jgi:hypothetical protein